MITANLHNPQHAKVDEFDDFVSLTVVSKDGSYVCIFIRGTDRAELAQAAADAINVAIAGVTK